MALTYQNLLQHAQDPSSHDVLHREKAIQRILRTINRPLRNNPLLLGEPGVGKTAIIQGLAFRLTHGTLTTDQLKKIYQINTNHLTLLLSEQNLANLERERDQLLELKNTLILIDDARLLFAQADPAALLYFFQPLLEKTDLFVCFICGMAEYRKYIEYNPIFSRELEAIQVEELDSEETENVLLQIVAQRVQATHCHITATTVHQACLLAKRYIPERSMPDKALSLLNEAFAKALVEGKTSVEVTDCKQIISEKTGIPIDTLSASDQEKLLHLEKELDNHLIGQSHVTRSVAQVIRRARAGLKDPARPIASFLFLGSSGVGKTELAKVLTRVVYHNERALVRFDMSEFSEPHTIQRLVGAPPGYIGFEEGGQLTNAVLAQPYSLILLDEIEKAHPKIFDLFLQVMDDGRLTDGKGRTVDFSNCILIATSNLALEEILEDFKKGTNITEKGWYEETILPLLTTYFRPEFINRFDDVLVFSPFTAATLLQIARLEVKKLQKRLGELHIELEVKDDQLQEAIATLYNPDFGARPIRRYLQENIENKLAEEILRKPSSSQNP